MERAPRDSYRSPETPVVAGDRLDPLDPVDSRGRKIPERVTDADCAQVQPVEEALVDRAAETIGELVESSARPHDLEHAFEDG